MILLLSKHSGGIILLDAELYYMVCYLTRLIDWCCHRPSKQWIQLEQLESSIPLMALPLCNASDPQRTKHTPRSAQHGQFVNLLEKYHLSLSPSSFLPVIANHLFSSLPGGPLQRTQSSSVTPRVPAAKCKQNGRSWGIPLTSLL